MKKVLILRRVQSYFAQLSWEFAQNPGNLTFQKILILVLFYIFLGFHSFFIVIQKNCPKIIKLTINENFFRLLFYFRIIKF